MASPAQFLVNSNPQNVDSGGFCNDNAIGCQRAMVKFLLLVMPDTCVAWILLSTCQPKPGYCPGPVWSVTNTNFSYIEEWSNGGLGWWTSSAWCRIGYRKQGSGWDWVYGGWRPAGEHWNWYWRWQWHGRVFQQQKDYVTVVEVGGYCDEADMGMETKHLVR